MCGTIILTKLKKRFAACRFDLADTEIKSEEYYLVCIIVEGTYVVPRVGNLMKEKSSVFSEISSVGISVLILC
jgi:hypothetical protein